MKNTPVHEIPNFDLLRLIPKDTKKIIEVGCSSGVLAKEFKKINPECQYIGIEIDKEYAILAERYCDQVIVGDIENFDQVFWGRYSDYDCFIFADVLEHLKDPWKVLKKISTLPNKTTVIACIPNFQHWSIPALISIGDFTYQDMGLLDKTHLRFFTRKTIIQLFQSNGFFINDLQARTFNQPDEQLLNCIKKMAVLQGADPEEAAQDATPLQYLVRGISNF